MVAGMGPVTPQSGRWVVLEAAGMEVVAVVAVILLEATAVTATGS